MIKLIQIVIDGGLVGLVYGLVAISFVVIYRASKIVNLAQGEVLVIGAGPAGMAAATAAASFRN